MVKLPEIFLEAPLIGLYVLTKGRGSKMSWAKEIELAENGEHINGTMPEGWLWRISR